MAALKTSILSLTFGAALAGLLAGTAPAADAELTAQLEGIFEEADLGDNARFSAIVVDTVTGEWLVSVNPDVAMKPASLTKMFTSLAAMHTFEPDHRFYTTLETWGFVDERGVLQGDVILRGGGDPGLGARFQVEPGVTRVFEDWAAELKAKGIRRINGAIIGDDSYYADDRWGEGWYMAERAEWYMAEVSALSFNDNCLDLTFVGRGRPGRTARLGLVQPDYDYYDILNEVRVSGDGVAADRLRLFRQEANNQIIARGTVARGETRTRWAAVEDPARFTAHSLRGTLNDQGVRVMGRAVSRHRLPSESEPTAPESTTLLTHYSAPLSDQLVVILANSQNLYAEMIGRNAALSQGYSADFRGATEYITDVMEREGILRPGFVIFDASGLSPLNRIPARSLLEVMIHVNGLGLEGDLYKEALARPGERGSLSARLVELEGRLRAKTGTLGDTNTIAGYLSAPDGREYQVVLMVDLTSRGGGQGAIDRMMMSVAESINAKARDREMRALFP